MLNLEADSDEEYRGITVWKFSMNLSSHLKIVLTKSPHGLCWLNASYNIKKHLTILTQPIKKLQDDKSHLIITTTTWVFFLDSCIY